MKKALVLGGGGSKGAYEIGVWKALDELNRTFDIVCGTSIGALIGTLYVQHDYENAYALWDHMQVDDIMMNGINLDKDMELIMSQKGKYIDFLVSYMHHKGVNISPFEQIIERLFNAEKFFGSPIDFGCMTVNFTRRMAQPMCKKDMDAESVKDYIIASASCFPAFPMKRIHDEKFIDGGYADNVPIALAKSMGAEEIVAVDLHVASKQHPYKDDPHVLYIQPYVSLGSFLLFDEDRLHRNMQLGYQDTMKAYQKYLGSIYTFARVDEAAMIIFETKMSSVFARMDEILQLDQQKRLTKKVVDYMLSGVLAEFYTNAFPYVAILERIAFDFHLDDLGIQAFLPLVKEVMQIVDAHMINMDQRVGKALLIKMKDAPKIETICFIYQHLLRNRKTHNRQTKLMRIILQDSFLKAYMLFAIHMGYVSIA